MTVRVTGRILHAKWDPKRTSSEYRIQEEERDEKPDGTEVRKITERDLTAAESAIIEFCTSKMRDLEYELRAEFAESLDRLPLWKRLFLRRVR